MAGDTGIANDSKPDAQAGASGFPELGYMSTLQKMCDASPTPEARAICWSNNNDYMGFTLQINPDYCGDLIGGADNWASAGPVCNVNTAVPPTYIVNGTAELAPIQASWDFRDELLERNRTVQLCSVSQNGGARHGTQLLAANVKCSEDPNGSDAVIKVFDFLRQYTA